MAKSKKGKVIQMLSPENYIKQKARTLPIHECWINNGWEENGLANITITRKHTNGNFTMGMYLIDLKCLGVKDAHYFFNISPFEYRELLEKQRGQMQLENVNYVLAHNIVFAGLEYAEDYGFHPHKDFSVAQYILEEDTDDIDLMEIDCGGKDGNPFYLRGPLDSDLRAAQIINQLEKTAGPGNYTFIDGLMVSEWDDDNIRDDLGKFEEEFLSDFDETDIHNSHTFQFNIQIQQLSNPSVWRTVTVPSYYTFLHFHYVIQAAFGWTNSHLYSFSPKGYGSWPIIQENKADSEPFSSNLGIKLGAAKTKLSDIFTQSGQKYTYTYDFDDDWHHLITLEKVLHETSVRAGCLDGEGKCPPEGCGGALGYTDLKEVLADKNDPDYETSAEWLGLEENDTWDPAEFDLEKTREIVSGLFNPRDR